MKIEKGQYPGAGWAWAAVKDGVIAKTISMNGCPEQTPAAFKAFREESRAKLSEFGEVVSLFFSCWEVASLKFGEFEKLEEATK